jgi:hypothetical protein
MLNMALSVISTVIVSMISAYAFLRLRCRRVGNPFGQHARWCALAIIGGTVIVSAALGLAVVGVSHHLSAACVCLLPPSALWFGRASLDRDGSHDGTVSGALLDGLMFPLRRLDDLMGEDMQDWCDDRSRAVAGRPRWVLEAAQYYHKETAPRVRDHQARHDLDYWLETIEHKITMAQLADLDSPVRLRAGLRSHPSTRNTRKYDPDDPRLPERLRNDAENELHLFLFTLYRLGFYKLLIYPMRPPPLPKRARRTPSTPAGAGPGVR